MKLLLRRSIARSLSRRSLCCRISRRSARTFSQSGRCRGRRPEPGTSCCRSPCSASPACSAPRNSSAFAHKVWLAALDRRIDRARLIRLYWTAALLGSVLAGPATLWLAHSRYVAQAVPVDRAALAAAVKLVPSDAGIAATSDLDPYFAPSQDRHHAAQSAAQDAHGFLLSRGQSPGADRCAPGRPRARGLSQRPMHDRDRRKNRRDQERGRL